MSRHRDNVSATCALLREFLEGDSDYRGKWHRATERGGRVLCQAGVARVVEAYLADCEELRRPQKGAKRPFKDRVYRAMRGEVLSKKTLDLLMSAFDMKERHRQRLLDSYVGSGPTSPGVADSLRSPRPLVYPQQHRTITVFERYTIDESGALTKRHTLHTVRAIKDGVSFYVFNHEPEAATVRVKHGGELGESLEYGEGLVSKEIRFDRPLSKAETTSIEYETIFHPDRAHLTEVRRTAFARCENVDISVEFTGPVPAAAWWCVWADQIEGEPVHQEQVLVQNGFIRKYLPFIENRSRIPMALALKCDMREALNHWKNAAAQTSASSRLTPHPNPVLQNRLTSVLRSSVLINDLGHDVIVLIHQVCNARTCP